MHVTADSQRPRPAFLPRSRWARASLLLLILFALLRSVLWASVQPAWVAPDEDYHWLYVNYLVVKHSVPELNKGEYTQELSQSVALTQQSVYLGGAREDYSGRPHAILSRLHGLSRQPVPPPPRPVLEAPAYYLPAAVLDKLLWSKVSVTRLTALRYYSAVLGALTIYLAWLLAAQLLAAEWKRLAAAALSSAQMILAFSASTITNDVGVAVMLTATLACCAWMLRGPPRSRQGIVLGLLLALAVLTKATLLSLVIVAAATLWMLWRTYPQARRELGKVAGWTVALPVVLSGWWYVYLHAKTNSILGARANLTATPSSVHGPGLLHAPAVAWQWISEVYRSYWFSYLFYEVRTDFWFWLPAFGMVVVAAGLVLFLIRTRGTTFSPSGTQRRSVLLIILTALIMVSVPLGLDTWHGIHGVSFLTQQGRFLTPVYPGLAVIAVIALGDLTRFGRRLFPLSVAALVIGAFVLYWHSWARWALSSFYGPANGHWLRELLHASYDKPAFVTQNSLAAIGGIAVAAFLLAFATTIVSWRRDERLEAQTHGFAGAKRVVAARSAGRDGGWC